AGSHPSRAGFRALRARGCAGGNAGLVSRGPAIPSGLRQPREGAGAGRGGIVTPGPYAPDVTMRRTAPYVVALAGAVAVTAAIGLVSTRFQVPGLSALYLLLVLWLGATWGRGPAVAGSVAAFLLYDYFFVPPVGTFTVRGPSELLELIVLLAVALVTGQLAGSLRRTQSEAEALAVDERAMYELATAALRSPEVAVALGLLTERAV